MSQSTGQIVNMMSTDSARLDMLCQFIHTIWTSSVQVIVIIALLINSIGVSALAGLAVTIVLTPVYVLMNSISLMFQVPFGRKSHSLFVKFTHCIIFTATPPFCCALLPLLYLFFPPSRQGKFMQMTQALRGDIAKSTDARVKLMNEILQGIRVMKVYAWEDSFMAKLAGVRAQEMDTVKRSAYLKAASSTIMMVRPRGKIWISRLDPGVVLRPPWIAIHMAVFLRIFL